MRSFVVLILVAVLAVAASAWETDLHYGLTKWLAVKAGFSLDDAETIANGAQDADEGPILPAPGLVLKYMCLSSHEVSASQLVQRNHFPSYAPIPEMPLARTVTPNDDGASRWTRMELAVAPKTASRSITLFRFGNSLHPLEDSWSHAGEPDIGPTCDKSLAWGHPKARGGVLSHDADITYKHLQDTDDTAHAIFDRLVELHNNLDGPGQPASWSSIQPAVHSFAKAATKTDKLAWFQSDPAVPYSSYHKPCFLDHISIPDGPNYKCPVPPPPPSRSLLPRTANGADEFLRQFLQEWIVDGKVDVAAEKIDRESLLSEHEEIKSSNPAVLRNMLLVWLNPDHGIANESGHGTRTDFSSDLRERLEKNRIVFPDLQSAIHAPGADFSYLFAPVPRPSNLKAEYVAIFQFFNAPRDAVSVGVAHSGPEWKVVSFNWVAF